MSASKYDFSIEQGSSYQISFTYKDAQQNPVDLTNWCARLVWKTNTNITQEFSSTNTDFTEYTMSLNESPGEIKLVLPATTTDGFNFLAANYDLDLQSPDNFSVGGDKYVTRILYGTVTIIQRASATSTENIC